MPAADDAIIYPTRSIVQPSDYLTAKVVQVRLIFFGSAMTGRQFRSSRRMV